jgi:hypothetical protein
VTYRTINLRDLVEFSTRVAHSFPHRCDADYGDKARETYNSCVQAAADAADFIGRVDKLTSGRAA